jgi:protein involved in temperature-dependent protein secretion
MSDNSNSSLEEIALSLMRVLDEAAAENGPVDYLLEIVAGVDIASGRLHEAVSQVEKTCAALPFNEQEQVKDFLHEIRSMAFTMTVFAGHTAAQLSNHLTVEQLKGYLKALNALTEETPYMQSKQTQGQKKAEDKFSKGFTPVILRGGEDGGKPN